MLFSKPCKEHLNVDFSDQISEIITFENKAQKPIRKIVVYNRLENPRNKDPVLWKPAPILDKKNQEGREERRLLGTGVWGGFLSGSWRHF